MNDNYLEVLEQYEGETTEVRRGRGAWICERSDGVKLLKEYRGTLKRLEFEEAVLAGLRTLGLESVDQYVRNREGELFSTAEDGTRFILKDWFTDRECSLKDSREILGAVSWIAKLHRAFRQIPWQEDWNSGSMLPPGLAQEMQRHSREMKRVRTFISGKRKKSEFELCVMQHFEEYYGQALKAQKGLELLGKGQGEDRLFLCHGDLNQHHILMGGGQAAFIEFSQMHRGEQMEDLYHFMRKVMEKHGWNEHLGLSMLESYDRILPVGEQDKECLYYLFLYPEKYWKQLNYYNNANKAWVPEKNVEKLKSLQIQQEYKMQFLRKIQQ
ncbi:MAG: spore coat protein CotS [Eubacteriales bacterium]|nr:spore coat protein CotS [Eubacteriales bacterium]